MAFLLLLLLLLLLGASLLKDTDRQKVPRPFPAHAWRTCRGRQEAFDMSGGEQCTKDAVAPRVWLGGKAMWQHVTVPDGSSKHQTPSHQYAFLMPRHTSSPSSLTASLR